MENEGASKYTISFGLSLALASVANALLVVAKERIPAVLTGIQELTGNQWVSHCAIVLGLFGFFGWLFAQINGGHGIKMTVNRLIGTLLLGVVTGGLIISGFYLIGN
jgi:hypothetical protein